MSPGSMQQLTKEDEDEDEDVMMNQIMATHAPDGREVDVKPLLLHAIYIINRATPDVETNVRAGYPTHDENDDDQIDEASLYTMLDALSSMIYRIYSEIASKSSDGANTHATTASLFGILSNYSWDAKLVLTLVAFAMNYGESWLHAQIYSSHQLNKSMAMLKQLPVILEHSGGPPKGRFDALSNLIKAMLDVACCIHEFRELPRKYITEEVQEFSAATGHIQTAVYWAIRSIVACATQITSLSTMGHEYVILPTKAWELSTLAHKLNNGNDHLKKHLALCYQHIEEKRNNEAYQALQNLFLMTHIDNMKVLKALIYANDDLKPLLDGYTKRRVDIEVLRKKHVLLLISGLDISPNELAILEQTYNESRLHATRMESQYEVVWIPIVEKPSRWTDHMQYLFECLQSTMPWYTVYSPSLIDQLVIRFIREVWHFKKRLILVVLDPQGMVLCPNAIDMMWTWGSNAFPFTSSKEEALWEEETWRLELLVDGIDPTIFNWIREGRYIFVYGGDDVEWIRKFTTTAWAVARAARIPLEMVYLGKSSRREQVRKVIATITVEKLSYAWQDLTMIWFFWTRLESMSFPRIRQGWVEDQNPLMQKLQKMLSYGNDDRGWAALSRGSDVVITGHGSTVLPALLEYDLWKENVAVKGFDVAIKDHHDKLHQIARPRCRFAFPVDAEWIPENMKCPECCRFMGVFITFLCYHD